MAKWLFYVALIVGILAFIAWLFLTDLPNALERMVTVFIIACPHALGLAIPLVVARSTSIAAKNGLLLKNRNALEQANDLDDHAGQNRNTNRRKIYCNGCRST